LSAQNPLTSELLRTLSGWLLLSQPPGCLCDSTSFPLSNLGALADGLGCFLSTGAYPPQSHCRALTYRHSGLADFGSFGPLDHPVLYLRQETRDAAPKCISENQLSRSLIGLSLSTAHPQQPWWGLHAVLPSPCPWIDHSRFGSGHATHSPCSDSLSLRLPTRVNLATSLTRRLILPGAPSQRRAPLRRIVGTWFQVLFPPPPGALTFPSRYLSAIGQRYLGLAGGPARFTRNFRVPCYSGFKSHALRLGYHPLCRFQSSSTSAWIMTLR